MKLPLFIALRYLFARKSHNVINIISAVSAAGMAVGTAALVVILSVYNGFDRIVRENLSDLDPQLRIEPREGKFFVPADSLLQALSADPRVLSWGPVLEENVFLRYGDAQALVFAKGVDETFSVRTRLPEHCAAGEFALAKGEEPLAAMGAGLAWKLGARPQFLTPLELWFPDPDAQISPRNPSAALRREQLGLSALFSISADLDAKLVILPFEVMDRLLESEREPGRVSALEISLKDGSDRGVRRFQCEWAAAYPQLAFKDRYAQHETLYRMMRFEKAAIYLILLFVVLIIAFNIFGALSMLMLEKRDDIRIFAAMGATPALIRRIFVLEGWLISLLGLVAGLVLGTALVALQQATGWIRMPGNFLVSAYPVALSAGDLVVIAVGVAVVGYVIALLPTLGRDREQDAL